MHKFKIDEQALKEACEILNIKQPVKIRWQSNLRNLGQHYVKDCIHMIAIKSLGPSSVSINQTLWHELTHASQWERYGDDLARIVYDLDMRRLKRLTASRVYDTPEYRSIPFEAEAFYNQERFSYRWLLA